MSGDRLVRIGSALALAGAAHSLINAVLLRRPSASTDARVTVLIPARDEAGRIGECLRSLVGEDVVVLDDGSVDATASLARSLGARVIAGSASPPGWSGKPWALEQLLEHSDGDVVAFVDADVRLLPGAVGAAVALLESSGLDIVCPFPRQVCGSGAERIVQPLLAWSWLTTLPLRLAERSARPSLTAACGQFVVVRRAALERIGGFAAVRDEVLDDLALVRAIKASGGRGGMVDGSSLAWCRMYDGAGELRAGYAKSLWTAFGSSTGAAAVLVTLWIAYVLPPLAMLRGSRAGIVGYAAGVLSRVVAARVSRGRIWPDALAHPLSIVALTGLTLDSVHRHRRGTLTWRGRPVR